MLQIKNVVDVEDYNIENDVLSIIPSNLGDEEKALISIDNGKVHGTVYELFYNFVKRCFDIIASICAIILLSPVFLVSIIAIKLDTKGPAIFTQMRIGKDGKLFKLYKFRTMVLDADKKLGELLKSDKDARIEYKINKKLKNDPRVTKVGKILRKTSIDELPQFINVLKGEMSLIGPRPYLPREQDDMVGYYNYIIQSKPGITGLWQVSGRSNTSFKERLKFDFEYNKTKSITGDFLIALKTVSILLGKEGAC